jgi:hypothetical protein
VEFADDPLRKDLSCATSPWRRARSRQRVSASTAKDSLLEVLAPEGLDYLPNQRAGIACTLDRPDTFFTDEVGLGKTIEALGVVNAGDRIRSVLIVYPAG